MADEYEWRVGFGQFVRERRRPSSVPWLVLARHPRVADLVVRAEVLGEACRQLGVGHVGPFAGALSEQHIDHGSPQSQARLQYNAASVVPVRGGARGLRYRPTI